MARALVICVLASGFVLAALAVPPTAESQVRRAQPRLGAVVPTPPLLRWRPVRHAQIYNVQLFRNGHKLLSAFPSRARLQLRRTWRYNGRVQRLRPAVYRWYVWPWFGSRYGRVRVRSNFILGRIPVNTVPPALAGRVQEGQTLTASAGSWTGTRPMRFAYQWQRCDAAGVICAGIPGAIGASHQLLAADVDATVRVLVTATNVARSRSAASAATTAVLPGLPLNVARPRIWGSLQEGTTLTADTGAWTSSRPVTYSFAWQRCNATGRCRGIAGATRQAYQLSPSDFGLRVRALVIAANAGGTRAASSAVSAVIGRVVRGSSGNDFLAGTPGADLIRAGGGADTVYGGAGPDRLYGGAGADRVFGGPGNDVIVVADRTRDSVNCGAGRDRVIADRGDRLRGCEVVSRR